MGNITSYIERYFMRIKESIYQKDIMLNVNNSFKILEAKIDGTERRNRQNYSCS